MSDDLETRLEKRHAERDMRDREVMVMDAEIEYAVRLAKQLPEPLRAVITELFEAVAPRVGSDGYLSYSVVGKHSPEMMKLARAVTHAVLG